jgi:hypothetical protein
VSPSEARAELFGWLVRKGKGLDPATLTRSTRLLEGRHITSLQIPDLLLFLESLREHPIDVTRLRAGDFDDIDTICARYLSGCESEVQC